MTVRTVSVALIARVQGYVAGIGTAGRATRQLSGELDTLGRRSPERLSQITSAMAGTGAALLALAGASVYASTKFDKQMSAVKAVSNATAEQMRLLRASALQAGKDSAYTAIQAGKAQEELAKAGISTANILGGALTGSLNLAAAGQLDLAEAADVAAKAMNVWGLSGKSVNHIADVLSSAANKSATDVHELGMAIRMTGNVSASTGMSLEETTGVLAAFADRALFGSDAGTSLKVMLQKLANPSEESAALMQQLGINAYDAAGKFVGIDKIASQLQKSLGNLTQKQRDQAMAQIFGSDAVRAATVLYQIGEKGVRDYTLAVDDQGNAARTAATKLDNLAGDLTKLKGTLSAVAIEAGSGTAGGLRILTQAVDVTVKAIGSLPGPVQSTMVVLTGVSGVTLLLAAGALRARQTFAEMNVALAAAGPAGAKAAAGLSVAAKWAGRLSLIGTAALITVVALKSIGDWIESKSAPVTRNVDKMTNSLTKFASAGQASGEMAKAFGKDLSRLPKDLEAVREYNQALAEAPRRIREMAQAGEGAFGPAGAQIDKLRDLNRQQRQDIEALDAALANLVNNGNATAARIALEGLAAKAGLSASEYQQLVALLPKYNEATSNAAAGSTAAARGMGDATTNAYALASSWEEAVKRGQELKDLFDQLTGAARGWAKAEIAAESGLLGVKEALDKSNGSLNVHTEAGRAARTAVLGMADAINQAVQAKYDETGSLEQANIVYQQYRKQLIETMVKAHVSRKEAEALADAWIRMPDQVRTNVTTPGLSDALERARALLANLNSLPTSKRIRVVADYIYAKGARPGGSGVVGAYERWGGIVHAQSGLINAGIATRPMVSWAEPATGGEAYIPRLGDLGRSRAIASHVVRNWLGGNVNWGGGGGGTSTVYSITVNAGIGTDGAAAGRQVVAAIKQYEAANGTRWRS